jgi:hypothetical protein
MCCHVLSKNKRRRDKGSWKKDRRDERKSKEMPERDGPMEKGRLKRSN